MDLVDGVLDRRSWRWFTVRLFGLSMQSRTWQRLGSELATGDGDADLAEADRMLGVARE